MLTKWEKWENEKMRKWENEKMRKWEWIIESWTEDVYLKLKKNKNKWH